MSVVMDYCYNEFLKMCEYLQNQMEADKRKFIQFVLYNFTMKTNICTVEELKSVQKFIWPEAMQKKPREPTESPPPVPLS